MTSTPKITNYNDLASLSALRKDAKANDPKALKEAARQFEAMFTRMMLKSMRDANPGDAMFGGDSQGDMYQGMFDDQLAVHLAQGKGMGLADMLVRQLQKATGANKPQATDDGKSSDPTHSLQPAVHSPSEQSRADFVRKYLPAAQRIGQQLGVDAHSILAQAALETSWGQSMPQGADGSTSFNMFGMKAKASADAAVTSPTTEYEAGVAVSKNERFRSYDSAAGSFGDYAAMIGSSPRYAAAKGTGDDVRAFANALQRGGYATDPNYADKVVKVAAEVKELTSVNVFKNQGA